MEFPLSQTKTLQQRLLSIDQLIRGGDLAQAGRLLKRINGARVPVSQLAAYGSLCRRTGLYYRGMIALSKPVSHGSLDELSPALVAEYALLLQRRGAIAEALEILERLDDRNLPEILLYRSFCLFNEWRYREAVPLLQSYLTRQEPGYRHLIGEVNLCAAQVTIGESPEGQLRELILRTGESGHRRLQANCLELMAQLQIEQGDYRRAEETLSNAQALLSAGQDQDSFFIQKWKAISNALRTRDTTPIETFRRNISNPIEYETLRSLDLYKLKISFDERLFNHLYFGTPFPEYRNRMEVALERTPKLNAYSYGSARAQRNLDLTEGFFDADKSKAEAGTHRLLAALLKDFYQPARLAGLFRDLFPGERFQPMTSPARVRMVISRVRRYLREEKIPVEIECSPRGYRAVPGEGVAVIVPRDWSLVNRHEVRARALPGGKKVSFEELRAQLGLSPFAAREFIGKAIAEGSLERSGQGKRTRYWKTAAKDRDT